MSLTQLSFTFGQASPASLSRTIYRSDDPSKNTLVLEIDTDAPNTTFSPGKPVPQSEAPAATYSLVYLDLSGLGINTIDFSKVTGTADGWTVTPFAADQQLCLTATAAAQSISPGTPLRVALSGVALSSPPSSATVTLTLTTYHVPGVTIQSFGMPVTSKSLLEEPPGGGADLHTALAVQILGGGAVVCSDDAHSNVANSLQLVFTATQAPATTATTAFTLTFVYAAKDDPYGYGALTTAAGAMNFHVDRGPGADQWQVTPPQDQQNPSWLLVPPAGHLQGTLEFDIGNVVSSLAAGPTFAVLSYTGVTGYADGAYVLPLEKYAHANVGAFTATPDWAVLQDGEANVTLTWEASNYASLTIGYDDVTNLPSYPTQIETSTTFTLVAQGPGGALNTDSLDVTAHVLPVINSFVASPRALCAKDFDRSVTFAWNVNTNDNVTLDVNGSPSSLPPKSWVGDVLDGPQLVTLVPDGGPDDPLLRRKIVVSAFEPAPPIVSPVTTGATNVAIAPTTGYVLVTDPGNQSMVALDTLTYEQAGIAGVGPTPGGMCFSPDGSLVFVVSSGTGVVTSFSPSLSSTAPLTYTLTQGWSAKVGGAPQQVATSPDGRYVYVTVDQGADPGLLAILEVVGGHELRVLEPAIPVGVGPRGIAVTASGARIYVANSGEDTVSLVGVGEGGHHSAGVPIRGLPSSPAGIAVTVPGAGKDQAGGVLLVACPESASVVTIDTEHAGTAQRGTLTVGTRPEGVALVPGGAYAVVANSGDGTISLLGLSPQPTECTVVDTFPAAAGVTDIAVSPDAGMMVATAPASKSVVAVNLVDYVQQNDALSVSTQPTDVAVSPDGLQVAVFHNALKKFFKGQPSTGVTVYDTTSQTTAPQLANQPLTGFAFHPSPSQHLAFAVTNGNAFVEVIGTSGTWGPVGDLDLSKYTDGQPLALAVSADGSTLFALAANDSRVYDVVAMTIVTGGKLAVIGQTVHTFTASGVGPTAIAAAPDASAVYVLDGFDGQVWPVIRGTGGYTVAGQAISLGAQGAALAIAPDGTALFALGRTAGQPQYNALISIGVPHYQTTSQLLPSVNDVQLTALAVSPDGTRLFAPDALNTGVQVFDAASLRLVQTLTWDSSIQLPSGVAVMPDGSQLFTANVNSNNLAVAQQVQPS